MACLLQWEWPIKSVKCHSSYHHSLINLNLWLQAEGTKPTQEKHLCYTSVTEAKCKSRSSSLHALTLLCHNRKWNKKQGTLCCMLLQMPFQISQPCSPVLPLLGTSHRLCTEFARPWDQGLSALLGLNFPCLSSAVSLGLAVTTNSRALHLLLSRRENRRCLGHARKSEPQQSAASTSRHTNACTEHYSVRKNIKDPEQKQRKSCQKRQSPMASACLKLISAKTISDWRDLSTINYHLEYKPSFWMYVKNGKRDTFRSSYYWSLISCPNATQVSRIDLEM